MDDETSTRELLTPAQRSLALVHTIDPGFVHHRRIQTIVGQTGMDLIDSQIRLLPDLPDWQKQVRINHIYTRVMLAFCSGNRIRSLEEVLATESGSMICSTETLAPCPNIYDSERVVCSWVPRGETGKKVEFHFSTGHICSDTMYSELHQGDRLSIIAELHQVNEDLFVFRPLVLGSPWLEPGSTEPDFDIMWWGYDYYQHYVEDFDEFQQVRDIPNPPSPEPMRHVSELAFKECLAQILGDSAPKDWGGEASDYFSAHMHLAGRRVTAAFLLKGPARFAPMDLNHLGKNNDQIVRLAHEPADVLIVQHSHDVLSPVRETLRAFAVQPSRPRRYCLIDGRDSLRLLQAYGLFDQAVARTAGSAS